MEPTSPAQLAAADQELSEVTAMLSQLILTWVTYDWQHPEDRLMQVAEFMNYLASTGAEFYAVLALLSVAVEQLAADI